MHVDERVGRSTQREEIQLSGFKPVTILTKKSYQNLHLQMQNQPLIFHHLRHPILPAYYLPSCFFLSSIVPKTIYPLASKEEMVCARFKTPENTPPEA